MTQPYPFTHTADTQHAKASAATRLRSSRLRGLEARFWIVGSEEARLRASLRPPPKLHVRFSRMQLSRRHVT